MGLAIVIPTPVSLSSCFKPSENLNIVNFGAQYEDRCIKFFNSFEVYSSLSFFLATKTMSVPSSANFITAFLPIPDDASIMRTT